MENNEPAPLGISPAVPASRRSWKALGTAVRAITPADLLRMLLVVGVVTAVFWLAKSTWPALLPFIVGGVVAYAVLPVTNSLDRFMPHSLAVVLSTLLAAGIFVGVVVTLVTVLGRQIYTLYDDLPTQEEMSQYVDRLNASLDTLSPTAANVADQVLTEAAERIRSNFDVADTQNVDRVFNGLLTLLNAIGFILGFLIIPAWLLMVLQDQRKGTEAVQRVLPASVRPDVLAVWRILDRAFRTFLEGQVVLAVFTAVCLYVGFVFFETIGLPLVQTKLAAAVFMGVLQLVPVIGPVIIFGIVLLNGLLTGFTTKIFIFLGFYAFVLLLVKQTAEPRIERRLVKIHPALLIMVVVALSEFGILWILVAAPITAVFRDLFMYSYGRLSNPPRPAGLLPDEPAPANAAADQPISAHVPLAYRNGRAARRSS